MSSFDPSVKMSRVQTDSTSPISTLFLYFFFFSMFILIGCLLFTMASKLSTKRKRIIQEDKIKLDLESAFDPTRVDGKTYL